MRSDILVPMTDGAMKGVKAELGHFLKCVARLAAERPTTTAMDLEHNTGSDCEADQSFGLATRL